MPHIFPSSMFILISISCIVFRVYISALPECPAKWRHLPAKRETRSAVTTNEVRQHDTKRHSRQDVASQHPNERE